MDMDDATRPRQKRDTETETLTLIQKIQKLVGKITVQFLMNEQGLVYFVNPCCEKMPLERFFKMAGILIEMTEVYNEKVKQEREGGQNVIRKEIR